MGDVPLPPAGERPPNTPNQTLYCRNLKTNINVKLLKTLLFEFFVPFGDIVSIQAVRSAKLREQAFVTFRSKASATTAMSTQQGRLFLGNPIRIEFAAQTSKTVPSSDSAPPKKRQRTEK